MACIAPGRLCALALLVATALAAHSPGAAADEPHRRVLSLSATGSVKATPDMVTITAGVETDAPTAKDALTKNSTAMSKVIDALKAAGVDAKDIQTSDLTIEPRYDDRSDNRQSHLTGYHVTNLVSVTLRQVGKLGEILDTIVSLGANSVGSIAFGVSNPAPLENEARKLAMNDAFSKAKIYADAAGAELGPVLSISEQQSYQPYARAAPPMAAAAKSAPIESGTERIEVQLNVTFELD